MADIDLKKHIDLILKIFSWICLLIAWACIVSYKSYDKEAANLLIQFWVFLSLFILFTLIKQVNNEDTLTIGINIGAMLAYGFLVFVYSCMWWGYHYYGWSSTYGVGFG